jgi:putative hydroxymethylpyrimidine transport system permease protein
VKLSRVLMPLAIVAGLLGLWQLLASTGVLADTLNLDPILVPSPAEIASAAWENRSLLLDNGWVTLQEVLLGFACALAAGLGFAILLHRFDSVRHATYPLLIGSQAVPIIVVAPILVVWFGFGIGPILGIVALICFFPITVNALDGLRSVDPEAVKMMRTLDASRPQILRRVELPSALPSIFSGAKIAVAVAVIGAVFGEWSGANAGLGWQIQQDNALLQTDRLFAAVFGLATLAAILFGILALLERAVVRWR